LDHYGAAAPAPAAPAAPEAPAAVPAPAAPGPLEVPAAARARLAELTKPVGSLGRLEELALRLAALQGSAQPRCAAPALLLFAGDHGVTAEGVSAYRPEVTREMVYQYLAGGGAVSALARQHGVAVRVVDVGVDH